MADKTPPPKTATTQPAAPAANAPVVHASPEAEVGARIKELQAQIVNFQKEVKTIEGRVANRNPETLKTLQKENQDLRNRLTQLEKALFALAQDSYKPRNSAEEKLRLEVLRQITVEYCKKANVDPEIWKSLVS